MSIKKKSLAAITFTVMILVAMWVMYGQWASRTKIGLINFQPFQVSSIVKSNADKFIKYETVETDNHLSLRGYDFVLGFGMGMNITAEQRAQLQRAADKGIPVYIHSATNPDNNICNLDSVQLKNVTEYLNNGNKKNYQSLARYIRKDIDRKTFFVNPPDSVFETASDVLYHLDETISFKEVSEYEDYLKTHHFHIEKAPKIAIVGGLNDPFLTSNTGRMAKRRHGNVRRLYVAKHCHARIRRHNLSVCIKCTGN